MEYFNSSCDVQKISDVPEYIVHMSKKNCDYKRIIRLIRMACKEKLHIEFIPVIYNFFYPMTYFKI